MTHSCTLVLILHNRHNNMRRLLEYYADLNWPIIIADSSALPFTQSVKENVRLIYTPELSFTQKVEAVLRQVHTPFCVMCADDDFILPESIGRCCDFLNENPSYAVAQGKAVRYYRESIHTGKVRFGILYDEQTSVESNDPLLRLTHMFRPYRSILYAVHRTNVLKQCFKNAGNKVSNLYLNEYLTAVVPVIAGKTKEFAFLYQIRESAEDSDDKTTDNLDTILNETEYRQEYDRFLNVQTENSLNYINFDREQLKAAIDLSFKTYASQLTLNRSKKPSFKKRIGQIVSMIPFIGKKVIAVNRRKEYHDDMNRIATTSEERQALAKVETYLLKNANS